MKILNQYSKHKYEYQITHREGNLAIAHGTHRENGRNNWEIIRIRGHNGLKMGDNFVPPAEFAPSDREWGQHGWTALSEEHAWEIFNKKKEHEKSSIKKKDGPI